MRARVPMPPWQSRGEAAAEEEAAQAKLESLF